MAFGKLDGEKYVKPKKEKERHKKHGETQDTQSSVTQEPEEHTSYGSIEQPPQPPVTPYPPKGPVNPPPPPQPQPPVTPHPVYIADLNILFVARNLDMHREFLASMNKNLLDMLTAEGLTVYTRDTNTINDVNAAAKRMEQFFWEFSQESWTYPQNGQAQKKYEYSISPAGNQNAAVHIAFTCVTQNSQINVRNADAIWVMTDSGLGYSNDAADGYHLFIREILSACAGSQKEEPVVLIQNQIEHLGTFREVRGKISLPSDIKKPLDERCLQLYASSAPGAVMIPVQTYGGLVYDGRDESGNPKLALCKNGYYQTYLPLNCQAPCLYTLDEIFKARGMNPFSESTGGGFNGALARFYADKYGNRLWKPEKLSQGNA